MIDLPPPYAVLELPSGPDSPAFWRICGVPVLVRLAVSAARAGLTKIAVVGADEALERARALLEPDPRLSSVELSWLASADEIPFPRLEATADVVASPEVLRAIAQATGSVYVPEAPGLRRSEDGGGPSRPLWKSPPARCFAVPLVNRADLARARREVYQHMTSPSSSPVARVLNEKLSNPISRVLSHTPVTPNQMTLANTLVGIFGAWCVARGDLVSLALGGVLLQVTSVLDCCDGELARCKLMQSDWGAWIDSFGDNIIYVAYMVGLVVGYGRFAETEGISWAHLVQPLGFGLLALTVILIGGMFLYAHVNRLGGSMTAISRGFSAQVDRRSAGWLYRVLDALKVMGRRAQFSLALAVLAVLPLLTEWAGFFHALFFGTVTLVLSANVYFVLGLIKTRARRGLAS